jgi:hypothetical protein
MQGQLKEKGTGIKISEHIGEGRGDDSMGERKKI